MKKVRRVLGTFLLVGYVVYGFIYRLQLPNILFFITVLWGLIGIYMAIQLITKEPHHKGRILWYMVCFLVLSGLGLSFLIV